VSATGVQFDPNTLTCTLNGAQVRDVQKQIRCGSVEYKRLRQRLIRMARRRGLLRVVVRGKRGLLVQEIHLGVLS
jgi:hypothetical protein